MVLKANLDDYWSAYLQQVYNILTIIQLDLNNSQS